MKPYWKIAFKNYKGGWFYGRKKYPSLEAAKEAASKHDNWKRIDHFPKSKEELAIIRNIRRRLKSIKACV